MNWQKVIADLENAGMTQQEIADACNCSQPYISQLKGGQRSGVSFEVGKALSDLYTSRVPASSRSRPKDRMNARA